MVCMCKYTARHSVYGICLIFKIITALICLSQTRPPLHRSAPPPMCTYREGCLLFVTVILSRWKVTDTGGDAGGDITGKGGYTAV